MHTPQLVSQNRISTAGVVESVTSRNIYATSGLTIESIYAEIGDVITEGQILAILDTENLELTIAQQRALI
jgi:multidrug efflux pump subunit AcrA (membrane-fusion protein)